MKRALLLLIGYLLIPKVYSQIPIHDRAIVAQQERMVFKQWDKDRFNPKPNRLLGIPSNPNWYLTWALHPNYPKLDRRPLSPTGEQTQRLALAAAMKVSSDYYKQYADSIGNLAVKEWTRISGAISGTDPLYLLYYKKELSPLESIEVTAFQNVPVQVQEYMLQHGGYDWYLENMKSLSERYGFAKNLDMERGQRIIMYHRIMLDMRQLLDKWKYKLSLSENMLAFKEIAERRNKGQVELGSRKSKEEEIINGIIQRRIVME